MLVLETEDIGLIAILRIGMGHVSGTVLTPDVGAELHKRKEFGYFQFGGSDVITVFHADIVDLTAEI